MKFLFTRNELFFMTVYFVQATVGISSIAQFMFTRNELGLSFIELGLLGAIPTIAWCMKPIYGFLTDLVPINGFRRKYYLRIAPIITILSWLYIWKFGFSFSTFAIPLLIANIGLGITDVICDALVVQNSTKETAGRFQAICWGSLSIGAIVSSFFSGFLITREILTIREMFLLTAMIPSITFIFSFFINERRVEDRTEKKIHEIINPWYIISAFVALVLTVVAVLPQTGLSPSVMSLSILGIWFLWIGAYFSHLLDRKFTTKTIIYVALFLFLWRFTPRFGAPWEDYYLNTLKISPEILGFSGIITYTGWFIGSILFAQIFDKYNLKKLLFWTVLLAAIFELSSLLIAYPQVGEKIGSYQFIKIFSGIITSPIYLIAYGKDFWTTSMNQYPLINLQYSLDIFTGILYMVSFLPLQKLAALSTPKNIEGTNFAVIASIMNMGLVFGSVSGGFIYENIQTGITFGSLHLSGLAITVIIGAISTLVCLPVLLKIKMFANNEE